MQIIKRSGAEAPFDKQKIVAAISKANASVEESERIPEGRVRWIADRIEAEATGATRALSVEEVQDKVEEALMSEGYFSLARKYITYRYERAQKRMKNTIDDRVLALIDGTNEDLNQENSNKNPTVIAVQRDYMAGEVSKDLCRRYLYPADVVAAHDEGVIHIHDMDYVIGHLHNCFGGHTRFVTNRGIRRFMDFADGEKVVVKDKHGDLREATVRKYGIQPMQRVTLKNPRMTVKVICTPNHRWIRPDGSVTTKLKVGDQLYRLEDSTNRKPETADELHAWCVGFAIGDGCDAAGGVRIRLCGQKSDYLTMFKEDGWSAHAEKSTGGEVVVFKGRISKQEFLNGKAWKYMSAEMQAALFRGLYAADGAKNRGLICTADDRVADLIRDTAGLAGYFISGETVDIRDTPYKQNARLNRFQLVTSHAMNWTWRVIDIERTQPAQAYCVEEPVTHSFTLDKGIVTGNCELINLEDMLQNGTVINGSMVERPKSFLTACTVATQISASVASNSYGGQTISLAHLAPFIDVSRQKIRKQVVEDMQGYQLAAEEIDGIVERRVRREVAAGVQTIQYQVSTIMCSNGQAPFISVMMYLNEAKNEREKTDLAMLIEEVLKQRIQGVKNEVGVYVSPAFPKLLYTLTEENCREGTKYWYLTELAAKCTAKRLVPDYISEKKMLEYKIDKLGIGRCYPCMGCRAFLTPYVDENNQPKYYGRFNMGACTLNLPYVALLAGGKGHEEDFWRILDEKADLCYRAQQIRADRLKGTPSDVAPILWQYGALARLQKGEKIDKLLYGGYATISLGYAGLWECVYALTGKKLTEPEGEEFGLRIMKRLNEYTAKWKKEQNMDYSLYGTPLESTTYKFAKALQRKFGTIPGVSDRNYITNSYHVHVTEHIEAFAKLALEAKFQRLSPGGAISYVEVPDLQQNIPAVLDIIKFIYDNIMYAELNTKSDYCHVCGFDGEIRIVENDDGKLIWECPNCGNRDQRKMNVVRRTCGYLGSQFWNAGRTQEIKERVLHVD